MGSVRKSEAFLQLAIAASHGVEVPLTLAVIDIFAAQLLVL
jgi:hypothetical protein